MDDDGTDAVRNLRSQHMVMSTEIFTKFMNAAPKSLKETVKDMARLTEDKSILAKLEIQNVLSAAPSSEAREKLAAQIKRVRHVFNVIGHSQHVVKVVRQDDVSQSLFEVGCMTKRATAAHARRVAAGDTSFESDELPSLWYEDGLLESFAIVTLCGKAEGYSIKRVETAGFVTFNVFPAID